MGIHFDKVIKQTDNPFLNMFKMDAYDRKGKKFGYYFASRKEEAALTCLNSENQADGVVIYAILKGEKPEDEDKIVLIKQYRYPLNKSIYELPAGLIEQNESIDKTAQRELFEETGFEFEEYKGGNPAFRRAFYQAQGLCDESNHMIFGYAKGSKGEEYSEDSEFIEVVLADKKEALRILEKEEVSIRCAYMLMQFINSKNGKEFDFLG